MATFTDLRKKVHSLPERVKKDGSRIIAETATEYYKGCFRSKSWEGKPWDPAKEDPGRGSLMVRSGELQASIRPAVVTENRVTISAGSPSVPYAEIHNKGGTITQKPTPAQKRFLWAMEYKNGGGGKTLGKWGAAALSKELNIKIPKRQFLGRSEVLNEKIIQRLNFLAKLK